MNNRSDNDHDDLPDGVRLNGVESTTDAPGAEPGAGSAAEPDAGPDAGSDAGSDTGAEPADRGPRDDRPAGARGADDAADEGGTDEGDTAGARGAEADTTGVLSGIDRLRAAVSGTAVPGAAASGSAAASGEAGRGGDGPRFALGSVEPGGDDAHDGGPDDGDELALRRLFQGAVQDLAPSEGALDHLRRAVPARRARKRQALVGVAAAVLLIGTAIPAFVHVASSGGGGATSPLGIGRENSTEGSKGSESNKVKEKKHPTDRAEDKPKQPKDKDKPSKPPGSRPGKDSGGSGDGGGTGDVPDDIASAAVYCTPGQLRVTASEAGAPDGAGKVYGIFRYANVSGAPCTIGGQGDLGLQAMGAADQSKIAVFQHTAGDPADGLPDPATESDSLELAPDASYEVRFAWVPGESCPTSGASPDPTPTEGDSAGGSNSGSGADPEGLQSQLIGQDGGVLDGSVAVTLTPGVGGPTAQTTIPNACAGTVYRTGMLAAG